MDPPYQRWSVWSLEYKQQFIETLLLAYPSPAIFLYRRVDENGTTLYEVVDGKQRLMAIFEFLDNQFAIKDNSPLASHQGKYFKNLEKDEKIAFFDYDLSVEYLPTNNETVINDIFDRLNRNTAKLTAQELRHAKYNGDFIQAAERLANWTWGFGVAADDEQVDIAPAIPHTLPPDFPRIGPQSRRQMKDVEIVSTLLLYLEEGVKGYSAKTLDEAFSKREVWDRVDDITDEYRQVVYLIRQMTDIPEGKFLLQSRIRNQADFYSFFGAIADLRRAGKTAYTSEDLDRLRVFLEMVEDSSAPGALPDSAKYFDAARSASNDVGPRRERIRIVKAALMNELPS